MVFFVVTVRTIYSTQSYLSLAESSSTALLEAFEEQGDTPSGVTVLPAHLNG